MAGLGPAAAAAEGEIYSIKDSPLAWLARPHALTHRVSPSVFFFLIKKHFFDIL
jgi:hypothetical protein